MNNIRTPTIIRSASSDGMLGAIGDFFWSDDKGPCENIFGLLDLGLTVLMSFPKAIIAMIAGMFGLSLSALGKHIDTTLGLNTLDDLAALDPDEATTALMGGMPKDVQDQYTSEFERARNKYDQTGQVTSDLTPTSIEKEAGVKSDAVVLLAKNAVVWLAKIFTSWGKHGAVKGTTKVVGKSVKTIGSKGTLGAVVQGSHGMMSWMIKMAIALVGVPLKVMIAHPMKSLAGAGAIAAAAIAFTGEESDWFKDMADAEEKPKSFRGQLEQEVDNTIMGDD